MASMVKVLARPRANKLKGLIAYQTVRNHWNKDWKPQPYPETADQRDAAAKKYNMLPNEYQPYPDDGLGYGDYPKLPDVSGEGKDPFYPWDFPEHKRNLHEPVHVHADVYGEDRFDVSLKPRYSLATQFGMLCLVLGGSATIYYYLENKRMFRPVVPKQYPGSGKAHYTFEPAE